METSLARPGTPQALGIRWATVQARFQSQDELALKAYRPLDLSGLPPLLADLRAAFEERLTTPTSEPVRVSLPAVAYVHDDAQARACDDAYESWKAAGGPARDNEARALRLQIQHNRGQWL